MSQFTGPGTYEIIPSYVTRMSLNFWGGGKANNTPIKLYPRTSEDNTLWAFVANGAGEYLIIGVESGLLLKASNNQHRTITASQTNPTDASVRWRVEPADGGSFFINNAGGKTQLNVSGGGTDTGTDVLAWLVENHENSKFYLRLKGR